VLDVGINIRRWNMSSAAVVGTIALVRRSFVTLDHEEFNTRCVASFYSQVVHNTEAHIRIMELLLLHGDWNEKLPEFASPPQLPPRKVSRPQFPILDPFPVLDDDAVDRTASGADTGKDQQTHR